MGAVIEQEHGYLEARAERLHGAHIVFDKITVTGTEDLLMAALLAEGDTLMENCAREPESPISPRCSTPWVRKSRARARRPSAYTESPASTARAIASTRPD